MSVKFFKAPPYADKSDPVESLHAMLGKSAVNADHSLAVLMRLWSFRFTSAARRVREDRLPIIVGWRSRRIDCAQALAAVGALKRLPDGMAEIVPWESVAVVDWTPTPDLEAMDRIRTQRRKDADRKRTRRGQKADTTRTSAGHDADTTRTSTDTSSQTPENTQSVRARVTRETQTPDADSGRRQVQHPSVAADAAPVLLSRVATEQPQLPLAAAPASEPAPTAPNAAERKGGDDSGLPERPAKAPRKPRGDALAKDPDAMAYLAEYQRLYPAAGVTMFDTGAVFAWMRARQGRPLADLLRSLRALAEDPKFGATLSLAATLAETNVQRGLLAAAARPASAGPPPTVPFERSALTPAFRPRVEEPPADPAVVKQRFAEIRAVIAGGAK